MEDKIMNAKSSNQGFKFFWIYLFLGSFSAIGNFANCLKAITLNQDNVYFLLNTYTALMCILFVIATVMFLLSTLFAWKYIYSIAYYIHTTFLFLFVIERIVHMIGACFTRDFYVIPIVAIYIGLILLVFLYFRKRKKLQVPIFQTTPKNNGCFEHNQSQIKNVSQKQLLFNHTCSHCGKTFKVKYNMPKGQTTIPNLSVICPKCNSKEDIEL